MVSDKISLPALYAHATWRCNALGPLRRATGRRAAVNAGRRRQLISLRFVIELSMDWKASSIPSPRTS